jgi:hypothetical protein
MGKLIFDSIIVSHFGSVKKIFTDVYMYDHTLNTEVEAFALYLQRSRPRHFSINNYDLVLDVINMEKDEIVWAYYYVDHDSRTLFWQDTYACGDSLLSEVRGVKEASHVSAYFPVRRLIPCMSMI